MTRKRSLDTRGKGARALRAAIALAAFALAMPFTGPFIGPAAGPFAGPARAAQDVEDVERALVRRLDGGDSNLRAVLQVYSRIEASGSFNPEGRYRIHQAILEKLVTLGSLRAEYTIKSYLGARDRNRRPVRILLLKFLAQSDAGLGEEKRAGLFRRALENKDEQTVRWAMKALSAARWPRGVDLIIERMGEEEQKGNAGSGVWVEAKASLYRFFGTGMRFSTSDEYARHWRKVGRKLPDKQPDYQPAQVKSSERTAVFFGEVVGGGPVFVVDLSSSMREEVTQYVKPRGQTGVLSDVETRKRKKYEWMKDELIQAVKNLTEAVRFNIVAYNSKITVWRNRGGRPRLVGGDESARQDAVRFVERIATHTGTHTQQALEMAFSIADTDTIYLLSDGVPSGKSAGPEGILKIVGAANYLRGARIVTLGFHPEGDGGFDEGFLRKLAGEHWGWYRRLNRDPRPKK